jgi:hypothetical protein
MVVVDNVAATSKRYSNFDAYMNDPKNRFKSRDDTGKVIKGRGTLKEMEMHRASRRQEIQLRQTA